MYPRLFNDLVINLGLNETLISKILHIYSTISPSIALYPEVESLLRDLKQNGLKLGLVTNGSVSTQHNKVRLLGLEKFFDVIVYAREVCNGKEKPDPEAYRVVLEKLQVASEEVICVGDNPYTDFWGAKQLGISTVRLLVGEFKNVKLSREYEADIAINSLGEISNLINVKTCDVSADP